MTTRITRLILLGVLLSIVPLPVTLAAEVANHPVSLWSGGVRLDGDVFKPADMKAGESLPGILLVHGWGGTREHLNRAYAPQFSALGFVVLTFDFKSWGTSNGPLLVGDALPDSEVQHWEIMRARGDIPPYPGAESASPGLRGFPDLVLPGKHYDIYRDDGYRRALQAAQDWFVTHLRSPGG